MLNKLVNYGVCGHLLNLETAEKTRLDGIVAHWMRNKSKFIKKVDRQMSWKLDLAQGLQGRILRVKGD